MSANAYFTNIDDEQFVGVWNGKKRTFHPNEVKLLPAFLSEHYAKHLTNKILHKNHGVKGENATSPKRPEDVPLFMDIFNKCYKLHGTEAEAAKKDELDAKIELLNPDPKQEPSPMPELPKSETVPEEDSEFKE